MLLAATISELDTSMSMQLYSAINLLDLLYSTGLSISARIDNACTHMTLFIKDGKCKSE